jgi:hypothetical protein
MSRKNQPLSSRELFERIGLTQDAKALVDEPLEDLEGDLATALRVRYRQFNQPHRFSPGDLVTWKPGLKNRLFPSQSRPAVVLAVLDPPVFDTESESGSPYFREPLDLVLGLFIESGPHRGDFLTWHFDSRRFQPWTEEI